MMTLRYFVRALAPAALAAMMLQACSADPPTGGDGNAGAQAGAATDEGPAPVGAEPGTSLAFEWSANGFEQVGTQYKWTGSGKRDDVYQPNLSLSVPETDDAIWSSSCTAGGKIETQLYLVPPKAMKGNRAVFRFETDQSPSTRTYPARYVADGQYDGFAIVQSASDPMFADMKAGQWAYIQIGEGSDAAKLRISLAGATQSLAAFLPACSGTQAPKTAKVSAATATAAYNCDDGRAITARYLGNDTDTPVVRLSVDGTVLLLPQTVSGSGARYETEASGRTYVWLTKAAEGTLIEGDAADPGGSAEQTTRCLEG